jgi:hypothetical protein
MAVHAVFEPPFPHFSPLISRGIAALPGGLV